MTAMATKKYRHQGQTLTADEVALLKGVASSGGPYSEIANHLGTTTTVINQTMWRISKKINIRRRYALTIYAYQAGIVDVQAIDLNGGGGDHPWA